MLPRFAALDLRQALARQTESHGRRREIDETRRLRIARGAIFVRRPKSRSDEILARLPLATRQILSTERPFLAEAGPPISGHSIMIVRQQHVR
jgi:hypothetical protein